MNIAVISGRLTADPQVKQTPQGNAVCFITVAVDGNTKDSPTNFIDVVCWRQTAEFVGKYFRKGKPIEVEGTLQTRTYQDRNGGNRKATEINANRVLFVKNEVTQGTQQNAAQSQLAAHTAGFEPIADDSSDDLPF